MVYIVCVARTNVDNIPISDSFKNMRDGNNLIQYQHHSYSSQSSEKQECGDFLNWDLPLFT